MSKITKKTMILMHKDKLVASIDFGLTGTFSKLNGFYSRPLMPPGTRVLDNFVEKRMKDWMENRMIPLKREHFAEFMIKKDFQHPIQFYFLNHGLSLNDAYWIASKEQIEAGILWKDINYFNNNFSPEASMSMMGLNTNLSPSCNSPDFSTNGLSPKVWIKENGKNVLCKSGNKENNYQEVFNEVIASEIAYRMGLDCVKYDLAFLTDNDGNKVPICKCENFCNEDWEFIPAKNLVIENEEIGKNGYIEYMKKLNLGSYIFQMLSFDYIIANMDRDATNYGLIRDNNTLEIIGMAPLFDNGNSLWCNWNETEIGSEDIAKTFETSHKLQIRLVENFDWYEFGCLDGIDEFAMQVFSYSDIPENIQEKIVSELLKRIQMFEKHVSNFIKAQNEKISEDELNNSNESVYLTEEVLKKRRDATKKQAAALEKARKQAQEIRAKGEAAKLKALEEKQRKQDERQALINKRNQDSMDKIRKMREEENNQENTEETKKVNSILTDEVNGFG